jgi:hypothetical protein
MVIITLLIAIGYLSILIYRQDDKYELLTNLHFLKTLIIAGFSILTLYVAYRQLKKQSDTACIDALIELRRLLISGRNRNIHFALSPDEEQKTIMDEQVNDISLYSEGTTIPIIDIFDYLGTIELGYQMIKRGLIDMNTFYNQFGYRVENIFEERTKTQKLVLKLIRENEDYFQYLFEINSKIKEWKSKREKKTNKKEKMNMEKENHWIKITVIIAVLLTIIAPFLLTRSNFYEGFNFSNTGQIGDTVGGITAPIIGLVSILLLYYTLHEQRKFNKTQRKQYLDEHFQTIFFNLLKEHCEIFKDVSGKFTYLRNDKIGVEYTSDIVSGKQYFNNIKTQLSHIISALSQNEYYRDYDKEDENGEKVVNQIINNLMERRKSLSSIPPTERDAEEKEINLEYEEIRHSYVTMKHNITGNNYKEYNSKKEIKDKLQIAGKILLNNYSDLFPYIRHFFSILNFTKNNEDAKIDLLGKEQKNKIHAEFTEYIRIIQAQMSKEEIVMLYYASFAFTNNYQALLAHYIFFESVSNNILIEPEHDCISNVKFKNS